MAFTYTPETATDITRVRFHIADTVEATAKFTDEEITFQVTETGSWQNAVISCLENLLAKLTTNPDFQADWLTIDSEEAIEGLQKLLAEKRKSLGLRRIASSANAVYRSDSFATEPPEDW